jgi:hypothetical protein
MRPVDLCAALATLLLLAAGAWCALAWPPHPDVAFYTTAARQLAAGATLYGEIGDVNPPAIYWLHRGLLALATASGLGERAALVLVYAVVAAGLLAWCARLLRPAAPALGLLLPPLLAAALTFPALSVFGEREHWAALLLLPHLAATAALAAAPPADRAPSRHAALAAALLAGLACLLKPPYLLLSLLLPELWLAWRRRRLASLRRPPALAAAGAFAAGAALLLTAHPAYLERVLPEAVAYYAALGRPLGELLAPRGIWLPLALLAWALALSGRGGTAAGVAAPFLWAAAGAALAFLLQGKGFDYQWLPVLLLALAGALALLAGGRGRARLLALPLLLLPAWIGFLGWQQLRGAEAAWPESRALAAALRPGERVFALNPELFPLFPAVTLAGAWWAAPESHLWQLDGLYRRQPAPDEPAGFRPPARQHAAEAAQRRRLVARFLAAAPDLVAIYVGQGRPTIGGSAFAYLDYLLADADFAAGWRGYRLAQRIGDYELYRRQAP